MASEAPLHYHEGSRLIYENSRARVTEALSAERLDDDALAIIAAELRNRRSEDLSMLTPQEQAARITADAEAILPEPELAARLNLVHEAGRPLRVKYGIDPTGADVHLGHAVPMMLLSRLQRMGHDIHLVVGDFTAKIGDPSGRVASRPVLSDADINRNMTTYRDQIGSVIDVRRVSFSNNSEWLNGFPLPKFIGIAAQINASDLLQRQDFRKRLKEGGGITQAELLYPVAMALDSVELESDLEVGGRDQLLNMQMCRKVMQICGQEPEVILTTDILEGIDGSGNKMSKTLGNYVALTHEPDEIYGRVMSIPDSSLAQYFHLLTELEQPEWGLLNQRMRQGDVNPMAVKKMLAADLTALLHGPDAAAAADRNFTAKFSRRDYGQLQDDLPVINMETDVIGQLSAARQESRSAIRRLLGQGAIQLIGEGDTIEYPRSPEELEALTDRPFLYVKAGKTVLRIAGTRKE